jgi:hypothetical protein
VRVELPTARDLQSNARGAVPDDRFDLMLHGFPFQPRPCRYQLSNALPLVLTEGQVSPDPVFKDGWNQEARALTERVLARGVDSGVGRQLYSDLAFALEEYSEAAWALGGRWTIDGQARKVEAANGKASVRQLTEQEVRDGGITEDTFHRVAEEGPVYRLGNQPLATLQQAELKVESDGDGRRWLAGRVHCVPHTAQALEGVMVAVALRMRPGRAPNPDSPTTGQFYFRVRATETPSGWHPIRQELPAGKTLDGRARLRLEAFLPWPRPGFYQIANELSVPVAEAAR